MVEAVAQGAQGQAQTQGQSPPGSSPATTPIPNRGQEAAGLATLSVIVNALLKVAPEFGATSEVGRDILDVVKKLAKHVPSGSQASGVQNNAMMKMMRDQQQQQPMAAMMAARGGGQPGAQPGQQAQQPQVAA